MVAVDSGTWPTDGGGVATCRELVLDYVQHVRWSVLSEIGNDFKQVSFIYCWLSSVMLLLIFAFASNQHLFCSEATHKQQAPGVRYIKHSPLIVLTSSCGCDRMKIIS